MLDWFADAIKWLWASRTYQPPWLPTYLIVVAIVACACLVVPIAFHRFTKQGQAYHDAWILRDRIKTRESELSAEKYDEQKTLLRSSDVQRDAVGAPPRVFAKEAKQDADGTSLQELALLYPESGQVSRFYYAVLAGHSVWERGHADKVEGSENGTGIENALKRDYVKKLVDESSKIVCIGVASSEPSVDNTKLADDRSVNLCHALFNIDYAREGSHTAYGLSIGEAIPNQGASVSLQRSVIIVGIGNSNRTPWPLDIIEAVTQQANIPGVRIDQYKRKDGRRYKIYAHVGKGELKGIDGVQWDSIKAEENPLDTLKTRTD